MWNGRLFIAYLHNFDKAVLSRVIDRVYVYGPDRVEIVWRADDIFYQEDLPEERKAVNPQEIFQAEGQKEQAEEF